MVLELTMVLPLFPSKFRILDAFRFRERVVIQCIK